MRTNAYISERDVDARAREWLERIRSSVALRPGLQLDPDRCALLVIDMLRYFVHPEGRCYLPAGGAITAPVARLLEAWRRRGGSVVFTRHAHEGPHDLGMLGRFFGDHIRADEPDSRIVEPLAPRGGEPVLRKTTYDAFHGTTLAETLRERGVTQVLITGVLTHMCCETTARAAFCRGFEVYVAADATASSREELHVGSLMSMADAVAIIVAAGEVIERCEASA